MLLLVRSCLRVKLWRLFWERLWAASPCKFLCDSESTNGDHGGESMRYLSQIFNFQYFTNYYTSFVGSLLDAYSVFYMNIEAIAQIWVCIDLSNIWLGDFVLRSGLHSRECTPQVENAQHGMDSKHSGSKKQYYIIKTTDIFVPRFTLHQECRTIILDNVTYTMCKISHNVQNQVQSQKQNMKSPHPHNLLYHNTRLHITLFLYLVPPSYNSHQPMF